MVTTNYAIGAGPAESRLVRAFFYIGEGAMLGGLCYICIALAFLVYGNADPWFVSILAVLFALVAGRLWAVVSASRASQPAVYHEWTAVRQWWWVGIVAVGTTSLLVALTVLVRGWQRDWSVSDSSALGFATFMLGLVLRMSVQNVLSRESETDTTT